jgi:hypothetical protein
MINISILLKEAIVENSEVIAELRWISRFLAGVEYLADPAAFYKERC